ncbi:MAG: hypothetical protein Q4G43_02690 [Mobilicoccus sp.]|nr:hypothetical protein [Mobilicoccus sp.]
MADPRVVVAGATLLGRALPVSGIPGFRVAERDDRFLAGAGPLVAAAALATRATTGVHVELVTSVGNDDAGRWCLSELVGRGIDLASVDRLGSSGEHLEISATTGDGVTTDVVLIPGPLPEEAAVEIALARCAPGDVLVVDAALLATAPRFLDVAYDRDCQIVADLHPVLPRALDAAVMERIDVAVVDAPGAGAVADAAMPPSSLAVHTGPAGAWWDDLRHEGLGARASSDGTHAFAGGLAAALAAGLDRPEAFALAVQSSALGAER